MLDHLSRTYKEVPKDSGPSTSSYWEGQGREEWTVGESISLDGNKLFPWERERIHSSPFSPMKRTSWILLENLCFGRFWRANDLLGRMGMPIKNEVKGSSFVQGKPQTTCTPDKGLAHQWGAPQKRGVPCEAQMAWAWYFCRAQLLSGDSLGRMGPQLWCRGTGMQRGAVSYLCFSQQNSKVFLEERDPCSIFPWLPGMAKRLLHVFPNGSSISAT